MGALASKLPCALPSMPTLPGIPEQDRIENRLKELVQTFTEEMLIAYKTSLITHIRNQNAAQEKKEDRQLWLNPEEFMKDPQIEGYVLKAKKVDSMDYVKKYWTMNKEYIVKEYSDKPASADAKPDNEYNFYHYDTERTDEKTNYTLKVSHRRPARQQVKVAFEDANEGYKWRGLIEVARYRAPKQLNPDPVIAAAFPIAINETRWRCWVWANWWTDGTEGEIIGDCFFSVLDQEIMRDAFSKLSDSMKKTAYTAIEKLIATAATAAWKSLLEAINPAKTVVEKMAADMLDPIFKAEAEIKNSILEKVKQAVAPVLKELEPKLDEHFNKALPALLSASANELKVIRESFAAAANKGASTVSGLTDERWQNSWTWWGRNSEVSNDLYDNIYVKNDRNWVFYRLAWNLIYEYRDLNQIALTLAAKELESASPSDPAAALKQQVYPSIYSKAGHDLIVITSDALVKAIDDKIRSDVISGVSKLLKPILEPWNELIPEAVKEVIDPKRTAFEIIDELLNQTERQFVDAALNKFKQQIEADIANPPAI